MDPKQLTHRLKNLVGRPGTPEPDEQSGGDTPATPTDGGPGSGMLPARESVPVPGGQADAGGANVGTVQDYGSPPESGASGPEVGGSGPAHAS